jgi:hypothetical protein
MAAIKCLEGCFRKTFKFCDFFCIYYRIFSYEIEFLYQHVNVALSLVLFFVYSNKVSKNCLDLFSGYLLGCCDLDNLLYCIKRKI